MSEKNWTPEPWKADERYIVAEGAIANGRPGGEVMASCSHTVTDPGSQRYPTAMRIANAARIVACVNACAGIDDPEAAIRSAKFGITSIIKRIQDLRDSPKSLQSSLETDLDAIRDTLAKLGGPSK